MPWTQADIDAIKAAIAAGKGLKVSRHADQEATFHSIADLKELLAMMQGDVSAEESAAGESTTRYAAFSKGI